VTAKRESNDVGLFMLMEDEFDAQQIESETAIIFDRVVAQHYESASVFWMRRMAALDGEETAIRYCRAHASRPNAALLRSSVMIKYDQELQAALERIRYFQQQVEKLRQVEANPTNYRLSASGYLTEIDRMHLAVREYLWRYPSEVTA
jgi:hypothetical protein